MEFNILIMTNTVTRLNRLFCEITSTAMICACAVFASTTFAQSEPAGEAVELEELVVTGSHIPAIDSEAFASPVTRISSEDIVETGEGSNLLEVLRKSVPQFSGSLNVGNSNAHTFAADTGGGAQVALRNASTLVLIDGRRMAFSPIAATGGYQFVDLNLIPVSAVDRVEIFKDGASAIYGSDATAGVVNIILKDDFEGLEVNGRYAVSPNDGHYTEERVGFAAGASDGNLRIFAAGEWNRTDPLRLSQRDFSNPVYASFVFPGVAMRENGQTYVLNPELGAPPVGADLTPADAVDQGLYAGPFSFADLARGIGDAAPYAFNLAKHETLLLSSKRESLLADMEFDFSPVLTAFANFLYSRNDTVSQLNAQPINQYIPADHPHNPFDENVFVFNRFTEHPRSYMYDTTNWRGVGGLRGELTPDIHFEVGALLNKVNQDYANPGVIDGDIFNTLISPGPGGEPPAVNLFAREQTPGVLDAAFGVATSSYESVLSLVDARIHGRAMTLATGDVHFAVGVEYRREELSGTADPKSRPDEFGNPGWTGATVLQPFKSSRNVSAAFAEVRLPIVGETQAIPGVRSLMLELATRHENYNDTDNPTVPRASLIWQPLSEDLVFRATYSESFNAPSLYALSAPVDVGYSDLLVFTPLGEDQPATWGQVQVRGISNPDLDPSESNSFTAGFVWSPSAVRGLAVEVDYFEIRESDMIGSIPLNTIIQDVETLGAASIYADQVGIGSFDGPTVTAPGELSSTNPADVFITSGMVNIASQELRGVDVEVSYARELNARTFLNIESRWTWNDKHAVRIVSGEPPVETAGRATSLQGTIPEWRVYNTASLRFDDLTFFVGHGYIPSMPYQGAPDGAQLESFQTFDLAAGYQFGEGFADGLGLRLGVNNVGNEMPPLAPELYSQTNADIATYGAIGRLFFAEATYRF